MKKGIFCMALFAVMFSAIGCSSAQTEETSGQSESWESEETEQSEMFSVGDGAVMETGAGLETEAAKTDTEDDDRDRTVIGALEEITTEQITVLSDNGNELTFPVEEIEIDLPSGIMAGNLVAVDYAGKSGMPGTEDAAVTRIAGSADTEDMQQAEGVTPDETEQETVVFGTLEELTMSTAVVETGDGAQITFGIIHAPLYFKYGLAKGIPVKVTYRGSFEGTDATGDSVKVVEIVGVEE